MSRRFKLSDFGDDAIGAIEKALFELMNGVLNNPLIAPHGLVMMVDHCPRFDQGFFGSRAAAFDAAAGLPVAAHPSDGGLPEPHEVEPSGGRAP